MTGVQTCALPIWKQFPLQRGEILDVFEIRQGMESITALYGSKGFIDAFSEPYLAYDEKNLLVDILMKVDEGNQYYVKTLYIEGLTQTRYSCCGPKSDLGRYLTGHHFGNSSTNTRLHCQPTSRLTMQSRSNQMAQVLALTSSWTFLSCPRTPPNLWCAQVLIETLTDCGDYFLVWF